MTNVSAILFDVDGTLVDTYRLYLEAYRRALEPHLGYAPGDEEIAARRPASERRFLEEWIGLPAGRECHAEMRRLYAELHAAWCGGIYDGVREMLAGLRSAAIPLGVVTGKGRVAWKVTSGALDLGEFAVVVTDDDVEHPKPHPAGLLEARSRLELPAEELVYVGDSIADMVAARAAGMRTGAALWPKTAPRDRADFLAKIEPFDVDWRFERPADLVRVFAPWC